MFACGYMSEERGLAQATVDKARWEFAKFPKYAAGKTLKSIRLVLFSTGARSGTVPDFTATDDFVD